MRKKIVDQICRGASPEHAARARALVEGHGNLMSELIEAGFAPGAVLASCSSVTGVPPAPAHWLTSPKPPHVELDTVLCRALGCAPVASMAGRLCIAYGDVEMAAQHASLGLPPHQPYLALREQLAKAMLMLPDDDEAETRIATAESLRPAPRAPGAGARGFDDDVRTSASGEGEIAPRSSRSSSSSSSSSRLARPPLHSDLEDPTEAISSQFEQEPEPAPQTPPPKAKPAPQSAKREKRTSQESAPRTVQTPAPQKSATSSAPKSAAQKSARSTSREADPFVDTDDSPREHDSEAAADDLLSDEPLNAGTPLPPPRAPPPSAGMIAPDEPWRRPLTSDEGAAVTGRAPSAPPVPIAAVPPPSYGADRAVREQSERTRRPAMQIVPVAAPAAFGDVLPPGVTPASAAELSRPPRTDSSSPTRRPDMRAEHRPEVSSSSTRRPETRPEVSSGSTRRPTFDDGALETPATAPPVARPDPEASGAVRRGGGFSIERSKPMPHAAAESLDPPVAPVGGGFSSSSEQSGPSGASRRPPTRPFESLDPHVEASGATRRPNESSGPSKRAKGEKSGPTKKAETSGSNKRATQGSADLLLSQEAVNATATPTAASRIAPIVVVVLAVAVVAVVVVLQGPSNLVGSGSGPPPPLADAITATRAPGMDGKIVDDVGTRQGELISKGQKEADHKKAVAFFDQAIRLSPNAPHSRTALLEKARRLLLVGEAGLAQDAVMQLKRRSDTEPVEEQIEQLLEDIEKLRQKK